MPKTAEKTPRETAGRAAQQKAQQAQEKAAASGGPSPLDELRAELGRYVSAQAEHLLGSVTDRITDLGSERGGNGARGSAPGGEGSSRGSMLAAGKRILGGESPAKVLVSEKSKGAAGKVADTVKNAFGGGDGADSDPKITTIVESVDIGVPLRTVYDHWTRFEDFSSFTKGVQSVDVTDDAESTWNLKVGPSNRSWKATVQVQVPDDRIVWSSEGAKGTTHGVVTFHALAPNLTRVVVVVEYRAAGFFEKTANLWRAQGRRLRLDLKHFQRYVTLTDEEPDGWRGEIRDGEVVRSHEEAVEAEEDDGYEEGDDRADDEADYEDTDERDDEDAIDGEDEDDDVEDEEFEDEDEDEDE